ncbi:MAG TPA: aminotransferase class I/II-fold pyridoxal phosphate-dependent enzyme [Clostridiaceae bacterium]|nr:aminotransferase class I/II-fold pyridoxal phosphate-dependent enzyme [Clostridiaceae bacterium]
MNKEELTSAAAEKRPIKTVVEAGITAVKTKDIPPFESTVWLSSPTMHGPEIKYVTEAYKTNWMSTIGKNIDEVERLTCEQIGCKYAVALSCGTSALHLAVKLTGVKPGDKVFCSDVTFCATANPVVYEGGELVFIDSEYETWNMDPVALEKAFELYPDVKVVVVANLYGTPAQLDKIKFICDAHGAILIEDAAESLGATYKGQQTGTFGTYNAISFNGNKIITGSSGGMLLTDDLEAANKARKWSTQAREDAPWYQHEELGYNYRMSNVIAGVVRGQYPYLKEHIAQKKAIYMRYKERLKDLPIQMNPYIEDIMEPNFWLSCILIDEDAMCEQVRSDMKSLFYKKPGTRHKTCPTEIYQHLMSRNAQCRPIWKPMHMQPIYRSNAFVTIEGNGRGRSNAYIAGSGVDVGADIFNRGLCLPSDNKMTPEHQDVIIEIIHRCFE